MSIKAAAAGGAEGAGQGEPPMPDSAIPFLVAIVAAFGTFIVVVGGVSLWSNQK